MLAARHDDVAASAVLALLSAQAVRERANEMLELGLANALPNFSIDLDRLPPAAHFIANVIRDNYPGLNVPPQADSEHRLATCTRLRQSTWATFPHGLRRK